MRSAGPSTTSYLPQLDGLPSGTRLFCFHHAGGAASTFTTWQSGLGAEVRVLPVQLPGRERRADEPRFTDMQQLVADLDRHLDPLLDGPHAFYGHSMGAGVAYHLTLSRARRGRPLPDRLLVGAYPPPHVPAPVAPVLRFTDEQTAQWLIGIGGMSQALLHYPEWARAAVALVRDDLRVCESSPPAGPPLPVPIEVFVGERDPLLPLSVAAGWDQHSTVGCRLHVIPGGHFFIQDSATLFLRTLSTLLRPL